MRRCLIAAMLSIGLIVCGAASAAEPKSSDECGACHRDIYRMWRGSAHAEATEDPFFYQAYRDVASGPMKSRAKICLDCHAPMAIVKGDRDLKLGLSREGVNCEFCHSLAEVEITERGPVHRLDVGNVKRGTIAEADSPAHDVAYSDLHETSRICAPCHEYVTDDGTAILTTYTEWESSSFAEKGETCQSCHMAVTQGQVVDPKIGRESNAEVNLHEMPGGHSIHQLLKALNVKVHPRREDDTVFVDISVSNVGAGHAVPTGMPGRKIILEVAIDAGKAGAMSERRVYGKTFKNRSGKTLEHVADYFGPGVLLESDSRIQPDEERAETFEFPVPADTSAYLTVKLEYEHAPQGQDEEMDRLTFFTDRKLLRQER